VSVRAAAVRDDVGVKTSATRSAPAPAGAPARPPALPEHALLALQRTAGNRAVASYVARQAAVEAPPLLNPGAASMAVSFYKGKPDLYTTDVITKIQDAVGAGQSGEADPEMAEAVAKWQSTHSLKVDGMAGPRTLPRMFETGLATEANREAFVATGKEVETEWATLATPEARADKLFEGVKTILDAEQVFTPGHDVANLGKPAGIFKPKPWQMLFDRAALSAPAVSDEDARSVTGTVYHEARHCEQTHKMARMLAGKGLSAEKIRAKMGIPPEVASDAFDKPLEHGIEFVTAAQQFESVYGTGSAHFEQSENEAPSLDELNAAMAAVKADPSPANKARYAKLLAAYRAYHDLPTEHDAFATEIDLGASWDEATP
jgi:peptidoglycan hydrolase-like protein with peptidoglycan-binding domain